MAAYWLTYVPKEESDLGWPLSSLRDLIGRMEADPDAPDSTEWWRIANSGARETPNKVGGGGGLATEAYLLTAACLEAVWVGANRGCSEVLLGRFRD